MEDTKTTNLLFTLGKQCPEKCTEIPDLQGEMSLSTETNLSLPLAGTRPRQNLSAGQTEEVVSEVRPAYKVFKSRNATGVKE